MRSQLEQVLDTCIAQLNDGQDLEAVLTAYPDEADELRPMLVAAALMRLDAPPPVHKAENKAQLMAAAAERRRQVERANGIVVEVKAGVPVGELLASAAPDVRPLIVAAWRMYATAAPAPAPATVAAGRDRIMALAAARRASRQKATKRSSMRTARALVGLRRGLAPAPTRLRRAWSGAVAALLVLAFVGATAAGVGTAAASSLPGDSFYSVKELGRSAQVLFAFDPARRAELNLQFAEQRLREMEALIEVGRRVPMSAVEEWLASQSSALDDIQRLPPGDRELLAGMLMAAIGDGRAMERRLRGAVDEDTLASAMQASDALAEGAREASGVPARATEEGNARSAPPTAKPLPAEKSVARPGGRAPGERSESAPSPRPQPEVVAPPADEPAPAAADPGGAPQVVQPVAEPAGGHSDREREERPSAGSATEPPATVTDPPPAFNQPIFEDPTLTPEPPLPPETPQSGQAEPPSLPVEPQTPEP